MTLLEQLRAKQDEIRSAAEKLISDAETRAVAAETEIRSNTPEPAAQAAAIANISRGFTADEQTQFDALTADLASVNERVAQHEVVETSRRAAANASTGEAARVKSEPMTYTRQKTKLGTAQTSYFRDLWLVKNGDPGAAQRLQRHAQELDVELPNRVARRAENAEQQVRGQIGWDAPSPFERGMEQRITANRTDGQGGYLVPPLWLMDDLIPVLRAGRVVADRVRQMDLPEGTDSINIPKLSTGTTTAAQTADNAAVASADITDTSVSATVDTIAGQTDIALQVIEQSPLAVDEIIFTDLIADWNRTLDKAVLAGGGTAGAIQGLYSSAGASPWTSYNTIAYTDASPTAGELFSPLAAGLSKIEQNRFTLEGVEYFMHSRRWFWLVGTTDSNQRPIVLPKGGAGYNPLAVAGPEATPPGYKGELSLGFPVYTDPNITTTDTAGSGTLQDIILALKTDDAWLFEGEMRQRTLPELLSGTLAVRFQIYNYIAFLLRYGQSLAIISGTGLSAPTGY